VRCLQRGVDGGGGGGDGEVGDGDGDGDAGENALRFAALEGEDSGRGPGMM